jgi:putative RNA 2'-phosphotransferase
VPTTVGRLPGRCNYPKAVLTSERSISKFLSLVLRHDPESIGITLDAQGWTSISELLACSAAAGTQLDRETLDRVVANNPKQRFAISIDGLRIRANQGHSIEIDLGYETATPPDVLYHGTVAAAIAAICRDGLSKMSRHHVHLSAEMDTASVVARRRGAPVIIRVASGAMSRDGFTFFISANGVWLTDAVPAKYLQWPSTEK